MHCKESKYICHAKVNNKFALKQRSFDKFSSFLISFNHFNVQVPTDEFQLSAQN